MERDTAHAVGDFVKNKGTIMCKRMFGLSMVALRKRLATMSKLTGGLRGLAGIKRKKTDPLISVSPSGPGLNTRVPQASVYIQVGEASAAVNLASPIVRAEVSPISNVDPPVAAALVVESSDARGAVGKATQDKGKAVAEGDEEEEEEVPGVWARELGPELMHYLYSSKDHKIFEDLTAQGCKDNIKMLIKPLLRTTSLLLYQMRHPKGMEGSFKASVLEERELVEAKNQSLEEEVSKLKKQVEDVTRAKEENENALTKTNADLEAKCKDLEAGLRNRETEVLNLEARVKRLEAREGKFKEKALKHKKAAMENDHLFKQAGAYSFLNAIWQVQVLNPGVQFRTAGAHPGYDVVNGQIKDGVEVVDLNEEDLMDPLTELRVPADYVDEGVALSDIED